jgi:hypothetical protein
MATINPVQLCPPVQLTASDAAYYTTPALTTAKIGRAVFCNTDTLAHTITMNIVATGGSSSAANELIAAYTLAPGQTYVSPELAGAVLPAGTMLRGLASTAAVITVTVSGLVITGQ